VAPFRQWQERRAVNLHFMVRPDLMFLADIYAKNEKEP
jgi:hypothetical protein